MQGKLLFRQAEKILFERLKDFPAVAILGSRQSGKSTLAQMYLRHHPNHIYLDLELPSDQKKLEEPELFFNNHPELICLDEIQRLPEIFPVLRSIIDKRKKPGQFLILGSASQELIKQSSESLAGRISYIELTPFTYSEIQDVGKNSLIQHLVRGGFPKSYLAQTNDKSLIWRKDFIRTFLERDIPQLGFSIPAQTIRRLWQMCAHIHGQVLNSSKLGNSLGFSHTTIKKHLELLSQTFMIRLLEPFAVNLKKRLIKSPKLYIRDTGLLHALLEIENFDELLGHPVYGYSWEGYVIENIITAYPDWNFSFYRTQAGAEIDLIMYKGQKRYAIECKASMAPELSKGFFNGLEDLSIQKAWVIAPLDSIYPIKNNITVCPLGYFLEDAEI